jgi:O-methyltransferase involved in polyketide biosynthesis
MMAMKQEEFAKEESQMPAQRLQELNAVAKTLLIPLYFRALESQHPKAIIRDPKAMELVSQLDHDFSSIKRRKDEQVSFLLRMRAFDRLALAFLAEHPEGVIVDLGCGLDTRFERIDNGTGEWYGIDLSEVIALRKELLEEAPRSHFIGCSVLDLAWMDALSKQAGKPMLFLAEAVLVYLEEAEVKRLVQALAEVYAPVLVRYHAVPPDMPRPRWGLKNDRDVEAWAPGIRLLSQWNTFDEPEPRLGAFRLMHYFPCLARVVRVVHYRLGEGV